MAGDEDTIELLHRMLDMLYREGGSVSRLRILQTAEVMSLPDEVLALFDLLPPGAFTRPRLVDQLNSAIVGHGLSRSLGTLE